MKLYTFAFSGLAFIHAAKVTYANDTSTDKRGVNIDISFAGGVDMPGVVGDELLRAELPVPYIHIEPNELENVTQIAEDILENQTINAASNDEFNKAMKTLMELSPEEMITEIIAKINQLEAIKAELSAEEQIIRLQLSKRNTTPATSIPVSYPVAVNPYATARG